MQDTPQINDTILNENYNNEPIAFLNNYSIPLFVNISNIEVLPADWGPKRDTLEIVIPITVIYVLTFISGVIGNISTCIVIARNKSMHTATNYYLFSLAISDLLLLISGLPPEIYYVWSKYPYIFGEAFCVMQGFAAETSANATVLTITAFTVERYVAICHPFLSHTLSKLSRAIKFIVAIWIIALCLAVPPAMGFGVVCEQIGTRVIEEHCVCMVKRQVIPHAFEISTCVFFVAPMSLITVLYVLIGLQLHRSTVGPSRGNSVRLKHRVYKPVATYGNSPAQAVLVLNEGGNGEKVVQQQSSQDEDGRKNFAKNAQAAKHVVKMLIAVVVTFFICWAPFHAQRLLAIYGERSSSRTIKAYQLLTYVSGVLYYLSTTVNPLLYNIMSHKFREAFKNTFKNCFRRRMLLSTNCDDAGGRCYATLSGRSSQANSHSNTDSYSRHSGNNGTSSCACATVNSGGTPLRYLDHEMARVHDSRRPLVVSFKKKAGSRGRAGAYQGLSCQTKQTDMENDHHQYKECGFCDNDDHRRGRRMRCESEQTYESELLSEGGINEESDTRLGNQLGKDYPEQTITAEVTYVEVHNLQPTHVCPLSIKRLQSSENLRIEDLMGGRQNRRTRSTKNSLSFETDQSMFKSCTMPDIARGRLGENGRKHTKNAKKDEEYDLMKDKERLCNFEKYNNRLRTGNIFDCSENKTVQYVN